MEFLQHLLPSQTIVSLSSWQLDSANQHIIVHLTSTQTVACCPVCNHPTSQIHSHYERTLKDLPVAQFSLILLLVVGKFFCLNEACPRRIFTERLPAIVAPWARRTARYTEHLIAVGLELGGAAAARSRTAGG